MVTLHHQKDADCASPTISLEFPLVTGPLVTTCNELEKTVWLRFGSQYDKLG